MKSTEEIEIVSVVSFANKVSVVHWRLYLTLYNNYKHKARVILGYTPEKYRGPI